MTMIRASGQERKDGSIEVKDDLEELREEMQSFSHAISHDFQAPVRRILCMSQIINEDHIDGLDEAGRKYLEIISIEADRMNRMITSLLTWSRTSVCDLRKRDVDLSWMVNMVALDEKGKHADMEIVTDIEDGLFGQGDPELLSLAIRELIDNAIKFAAEGAVRKIKFGARSAGGRKVYFIQDNGVGFDQAYAGKLFKHFQRLHGQEFAGEGMGLAIAALVVKRHGGSIWAESKLGEGSTFYFTLQ